MENLSIIRTLAGIENRLDPEGTIEIVWPEPGDSIVTIRVADHRGQATVHLDRVRVAELVLRLAAAGNGL